MAITPRCAARRSDGPQCLELMRSAHASLVGDDQGVWRQPMADIFVSYARHDKALVAPLVAALEREGYSVWWDPAIAPGQEFDRQIVAELDAARAVIVVWTPVSVDSRWVRGEAREAADAFLCPYVLKVPRCHWMCARCTPPILIIGARTRRALLSRKYCAPLARCSLLELDKAPSPPQEAARISSR